MTLQGGVFAALLRLCALLPLRANRALGAAIGGLAYLLPNRTRNVARRNLELCFPETHEAGREALLQTFLQDTGQSLTELGIIWYSKPDRVLGMLARVVGIEHLEMGLRSGDGVLIIAPHLGSWEFLVQFLARRGACTFFYREPRNPGIDQVITGGRQRFGASLVKAGSSAVRKAMRALKKGEIVGLMPDQQPKLGQGQFSPFFATPALTMVLASRLAQKTRARVLFAAAVRLPKSQGFEVHVVPADEDIRGGDLQASVDAINAQVEALARRWPAQYQWGYKRFSIRPEGEEPMYETRE